MKEISRNDISEFLTSHSLVLDDWNKLICSVESKVIQVLPDEYGSNFYDVSCVLSNWIGSEENVYLFFDSSTCLTREEPTVFFRCIAKLAVTPETVYKKIYSISKSESTSLLEHYSTLALLINFSIFYEWHVTFVNEKNHMLRISDGILYLKAGDIHLIQNVANALTRKPIPLAKWQLDSEQS